MRTLNSDALSQTRPTVEQMSIRLKSFVEISDAHLKQRSTLFISGIRGKVTFLPVLYSGLQMISHNANRKVTNIMVRSVLKMAD